MSRRPRPATVPEATREAAVFQAAKSLHETIDADVAVAITFNDDDSTHRLAIGAYVTPRLAVGVPRDGRDAWCDELIVTLLEKALEAARRGKFKIAAPPS